MATLTSNIMEIIEPENQLYNSMLNRCTEIPKYECNRYHW